MSEDNIILAFHRTLTRFRRAIITFAPNEIDYVSYLLTLNRAGKLKLENGRIVAEISATRSWRDNKNRTTTIIPTDEFDPKQFASLFKGTLEKIEVY